MTDPDPNLFIAAQIFYAENYISISLLRRKMNINIVYASELFEQLLFFNIIIKNNSLLFDNEWELYEYFWELKEKYEVGFWI